MLIDVLLSQKLGCNCLHLTAYNCIRGFKELTLADKTGLSA